LQFRPKEVPPGSVPSPPIPWSLVYRPVPVGPVTTFLKKVTIFRPRSSWRPRTRSDPLPTLPTARQKSSPSPQWINVDSRLFPLTFVPCHRTPLLWTVINFPRTRPIETPESLLSLFFLFESVDGSLSVSRRLLVNQHYINTSPSHPPPRERRPCHLSSARRACNLRFSLRWVCILFFSCRSSKGKAPILGQVRSPPNRCD